MKILIDMNLSPDWRSVFVAEGWEARQYSELDMSTATDRQIMDWAAQHDHLVLTHDLDFGAILAATRAAAPSVIQIRAQDGLPDKMGSVLVQVIRAHFDSLMAGALVTVDPRRSRVRKLPLRTDHD